MNKNQFMHWLQASDYRRPLVMGILNLTPNSFFDGGKYTDINKACEYAKAMIADGADIIDVGGESTKPGVKPISLDEELARVIPFIERLRAIDKDICISIDTYKPEIMREAIAAGATIINDIYALTVDGALQAAKSLDVPVVLMHMRGHPESMQKAPSYEKNIIDEINDFFVKRIEDCLQAGVSKQNIILDPGFGFGKTLEHNLSILHYLSKFQQHKLPILLGVSRKSTIGAILDKGPENRLIGSLTMAAFAIMQGVSIIRVHDVAKTQQVIKILNAINLRGEVNE